MRHTNGAIWAVFEKPVRMYRGNTMAGCIKDERYHKPDREFVGGYYMQTLHLGLPFGRRQERQPIILVLVVKARFAVMGFATNGVRLTT
jgi:hypothetical protein